MCWFNLLNWFLRTVSGSNNYPCNIESGPRMGEACAFPYFYPDCSLMKPSGGCDAQLRDMAPSERKGCILENNDNMWCSSRTYQNRSRERYSSLKMEFWPGPTSRESGGTAQRTASVNLSGLISITSLEFRFRFFKKFFSWFFSRGIDSSSGA